MRYYLILIALSLSLQTHASDVWLFLKDGRVGLGDPAALTGTLADGTALTFTKDDIQSQRTVVEMDQAVDAMLADIAHGRNLDAHATRFRTFKNAAVPRLLQHLKDDAQAGRISALYALQFCWSPQAMAAVDPFLDDNDPNIFKGAMAAACNNSTVNVMVKRLAGRADDPNLIIASAIFELIEKYKPDATLKRFRRMLSDAKARTATLPVLSHYFAPDLTPLTLPLLSSTNAAEKRAAVVALIQQNADGADVRKRLLAMLASTDADLRETLADYFTWLGRSEDLEALRAARKTETDLYARSALDGALKVIEHRSTERAKLPDGKSNVIAKANTAENSLAGYASFLTAFASTPNRGDLDAALAFYRTADLFEPFTPYAVGYPDDPACRFRLRTLLAQHLFAAPCGVLDDKAVTECRDEKEAPAARQLVPPIREYFDARRKSFGFFMDADRAMFANSVHVGDDCGWNHESRSVVSIAPGVVRLVAHIFTWGHIVVVEHTGADGKKFCSLYGHLSPLIHVRPGEIVEAGQKLGCIGRCNSVDNGGYGAHLHFGIHKGPYATDTRWVCGYVDPLLFKNGEHGWFDPQNFLQTQGAKPVVANLPPSK